MNTLITLDIDGTITDHHSELSQATLDYIHSLYRKGVQFAFITGRTYQWGFQILDKVDIPYYFAIHNGAIILKMPEKKIVSKKYLDVGSCVLLDEICKSEPTDYVIYGGYEVDDACYYRPDQFDSETYEYLQKRISSIKEKWVPLKSHQQLPIDSFPSVKCFGKHDSALRIATQIEERMCLHAPMNRDPFNHDHYVVQATHPDVNKGEALRTLRSLIPNCGVVIAAGDDLNDIPMLEAADISIGMETAPKSVIEIADITAPAASKDGIIDGIQKALIKITKEEQLC